MRRSAVLLAVTLFAAPSLFGGSSLFGQSRRTTRATATPPAAPARPPAPGRTWSAVSAGGAHTCALDAAGQGYCWGENAWKRLGIADSVNQRRPVPVATPQRFRFIQAGSTESCAVTAEGAVVCWGGEQPGTAPHSAFGDLRFRSLDLAADGCGVTGDGVAWCWGSNSHGQRGSGRDTPARSTAPERVAGGKRWQTVVAGNNYACGIAADASAWCWGSAALLGNGATQSSEVPVAVAGGRSWRQLAGGAEHVCGVTTDGAALCWGSNSNGELGNGQTQSAPAPVVVSGTNTFKELAAGYGFTCGLTNQGRVYCWGWNRFGVLGTGNLRAVSTPTKVGGEPFLFFTSISAGNGHVCGLGTDGALYCWGDNSDGALGIARSQSCRFTSGGRSETRACAMVPTRVQDPR